jgi:hypothetical protein
MFYDKKKPRPFLAEAGGLTAGRVKRSVRGSSHDSAKHFWIEIVNGYLELYGSTDSHAATGRN